MPAAAFDLALDGLLLRHGRHYWRLAPDTGHWQVNDGGRWRDSDPSASPSRPPKSILPAALLIGAVAVFLYGLLWWEPPRLPVVSMAVAEAPAAPAAASTEPTALPDPVGGAAVIERAFQLLLDRALTAAAVDALEPVLSWEARLRPWAIQFVRWPEQEHLELVGYEPASLEPNAGAVLRAQAVGVYRAEDREHVRVRWAFTLVPEDDQWRIKSIVLVGLERGAN